MKKILPSWYETTPQIHHAVRAFVEAPRRMGARAMVVFGPPGAGKTALGEALAEGIGAALVFYQCHAWTDADELFVGVDVPAAVAGDAASVRQAGALLRAAESSRRGPVVLIIDELDKAPERVDALLLDYLQSGRVPIRPGEHVQADLDRLYVLITSNGLRDLSDPLMRRARRLWMPPMPADLMERVAGKLTGAPAGVVRIARKAAQEIAAADGAVLSLQELVRLVDELMLASSLDDVRNTLAAWAARGEEGEALAQKTPLASTLWGRCGNMSAPEKRSWTLRDIRRLLGRAYDPDALTPPAYAFGRYGREAWRVYTEWVESTLPREDWPVWVGQAIRHFDRLIALYGPDATEPPMKKEEEKATAANRPGQPGSPEGDRAAEGETNASGEGPARQDGDPEPRAGSSPPSQGAAESTDHGAAEPFRGEPTGENPSTTEGPGAGPGGAPEPVDRDEPHPGGAAGASAVEEDGAVAKAGSSGPGREGPDGDAEAPSPSPTRPGTDDAEANDVSGVNPDDAAAMDAHGTSAPPSPVRSGQWGGRYVDYDYRLPPHDRKGAKEIIRLLRRVIAAAEPGLGIEQSPRIAGRKLVRELASRRANVTRARRDELDIPIVLILADVSGSCSAVSTETFAAAVELSRLDERVVAIEHSNGVPIAVYAHGRVERFVDHYEAVAWWKEYILRHRIGAVVAFGDEDAFEIFCILSRTAPLVWLDSYTASLGVVRDQTERMRKDIPVAAYLVGVNSASTAAIALRMAERRLRK